MNVYGYTRTGTESEARQVKDAMVHWCMCEGHALVGFSWDGQAGRRGIQRATKSLSPGDGVCSMLLVERLSDLSHDLVSLVKIVQGLLTIGVTVSSLAEMVELMSSHAKAGDAATRNPETRLLAGLLEAHQRYIGEARKHGMATARANGAQIGRPAGLTLEDVQEPLRRLMNANDGKLPSVRDAAKSLTAAGKKCSTGTAAKLLKQFQAKLDAERQQPTGEDE